MIDWLFFKRADISLIYMMIFKRQAAALMPLAAIISRPAPARYFRIHYFILASLWQFHTCLGSLPLSFLLSASFFILAWRGSSTLNIIHNAVKLHLRCQAAGRSISLFRASTRSFAIRTLWEFHHSLSYCYERYFVLLFIIAFFEVAILLASLSGHATVFLRLVAIFRALITRLT